MRRHARRQFLAGAKMVAVAAEKLRERKQRHRFWKHRWNHAWAEGYESHVPHEPTDIPEPDP